MVLVLVLELRLRLSVILIHSRVVSSTSTRSLSVSVALHVRVRRKSQGWGLLYRSRSALESVCEASSTICAHTLLCALSKPISPNWFLHSLSSTSRISRPSDSKTTSHYPRSGICICICTSISGDRTTSTHLILFVKQRTSPRPLPQLIPHKRHLLFHSSWTLVFTPLKRPHTRPPNTLPHTPLLPPKHRIPVFLPHALKHRHHESLNPCTDFVCVLVGPRDQDVQG